MSVDYAPTLVAILFGLAFSCLFLAIARFLGPKRGGETKLSPFECDPEATRRFLP